MNTRIFVSYTLKDGCLDVSFLKELKSFIKDHCISYIDVLDNDSEDRQARVVEELLRSDCLFLIRTFNVNRSDWVKREILIAKENNIPIMEFDFQDLIYTKFQSIMHVISIIRGSLINSEFDKAVEW